MTKHYPERSPRKRLKKNIPLKEGRVDRGTDLGVINARDELSGENVSIPWRVRDEQHIRPLESLTPLEQTRYLALPIERFSVDAPQRTLFESVQNPENWKYPTRPAKVASLPEAEALSRAISYFAGGSEITDLSSGYVVSSKGYYQYVGA